MIFSFIWSHRTFTLRLSRSCFKSFLGGSLLLTIYMRNFASPVKATKKLPCSKIRVHKCAAKCDLSDLSCAVNFWTTCNLYDCRCRFFRRILWKVVSDICNSALAPEIDFFRFCMKAYITLSTFSSNLLCHSVECLLLQCRSVYITHAIS